VWIHRRLKRKPLPLAHGTVIMAIQPKEVTVIDGGLPERPQLPQHKLPRAEDRRTPQLPTQISNLKATRRMLRKDTA